VRGTGVGVGSGDGAGVGVGTGVGEGLGPVGRVADVVALVSVGFVAPGSLLTVRVKTCSSGSEGAWP